MGKNFNTKAKEQRQWLNWKTVMTHFALLNTKLPSGEELEAYKVNLTSKGED